MDINTHYSSFGPDTGRDYRDSVRTMRGILTGLALSPIFWVPLATGVFVATR